MAGVSGIETDDDTEDDGELDLETIADDQTGNLSMDELQRMLDSALEQEDYEKASHIRDEINRRKAG
jgi:protein-arginine kinase activator protein McsA